MLTVLSKSYPASGRPQSFVLVSSEDDTEIRRLCDGYSYVIEEVERDENYTIGDAWEDLAYIDARGFAQWRR